MVFRQDKEIVVFDVDCVECRNSNSNVLDLNGNWRVEYLNTAPSLPTVIYAEKYGVMWRIKYYIPLYAIQVENRNFFFILNSLFYYVK